MVRAVSPPRLVFLVMFVFIFCFCFFGPKKTAFNLNISYELCPYCIVLRKSGKNKK